MLGIRKDKTHITHYYYRVNYLHINDFPFLVSVNTKSPLCVFSLHREMIIAVLLLMFSVLQQAVCSMNLRLTIFLICYLVFHWCFYET